MGDRLSGVVYYSDMLLCLQRRGVFRWEKPEQCCYEHSWEKMARSVWNCVTGYNDAASFRAMIYAIIASSIEKRCVSFA